jgi:hypothetical protein
LRSANKLMWRKTMIRLHLQVTCTCICIVNVT